MKRALILFFSALYLVVTTGFSMNMHFCGNHLVELKINASTKEENCCGQKEIKKGCCKEKNTIIKVSDKHLLKDSPKINTPKIAIAKLDLSFKNKPLLLFNKSTLRSNVIHPPPLHQKIPLYIKIRVLTI